MHAANDDYRIALDRVEARAPTATAEPAPGTCAGAAHRGRPSRHGAAERRGEGEGDTGPRHGP